MILSRIRWKIRRYRQAGSCNLPAGCKAGKVSNFGRKFDRSFDRSFDRKLDRSFGRKHHWLVPPDCIDLGLALDLGLAGCCYIRRILRSYLQRPSRNRQRHPTLAAYLGNNPGTASSLAETLDAVEEFPRTHTLSRTITAPSYRTLKLDELRSYANDWRMIFLRSQKLSDHWGECKCLQRITRRFC